MDNSSILEKLKEAVEETCSELGFLADGMEIKYSHLCGQTTDVGFGTEKPSNNSEVIDVIIVKNPYRSNGWNVLIYGIESCLSEFFMENIRKKCPEMYVFEGHQFWDNKEFIYIYISF